MKFVFNVCAGVHSPLTKYVTTTVQIRHLPYIEQSKQFELIHDYIRKLSNRRGCPSSGIIYARTRATCDELARYLRNHGVAARPYHRGVPNSKLNSTLKEWLDGSVCEVVCCTVAFGLGIDKGDVRCVRCHWTDRHATLTCIG
jgi:superfamily II DNA helicase RecQ